MSDEESSEYTSTAESSTEEEEDEESIEGQPTWEDNSDAAWADEPLIDWKFLDKITVKQIGIFALWIAIYIVFIKIEFGIIYFLISALVAIYYNTTTEPRKPNELSPYSVFNKGCHEMEDVLGLRAAQGKLNEWLCW